MDGDHLGQAPQAPQAPAADGGSARRRRAGPAGGSSELGPPQVGEQVARGCRAPPPPGGRRRRLATRDQLDAFELGQRARRAARRRPRCPSAARGAHRWCRAGRASVSVRPAPSSEPAQQRRPPAAGSVTCAEAELVQQLGAASGACRGAGDRRAAASSARSPCSASRSAAVAGRGQQQPARPGRAPGAPPTASAPCRPRARSPRWPTRARSVVGERQRRRRRGSVRSSSPGWRWRARVERRLGDVGPDRVGAGTGQRGGERARPAAEVEHPVAAGGPRRAGSPAAAPDRGPQRPRAAAPRAPRSSPARRQVSPPRTSRGAAGSTPAAIVEYSGRPEDVRRNRHGR